MTTFIDIILQFNQQNSSVAGKDGDEHYHVTIKQAPGQGWGGPVAGSDLDTGEIETIRLLYRQFITRQQRMGNTLDERDGHTLRIVGDKLYQALPESVQVRLDGALAVARSQNKPLLLTLIFEPSAESLLALPWELLHHHDGRFFFALQGGGIVRQLSLPPDWRPQTDFRPHDTLGLWAEPSNISPLTTRSAAGPSPDHPSPIHWRQGADSLAQLHDALSTGDFDSLHLTAHGRFGSDWGNFTIALEDKDRNPQWISAEQLTTMLHQYPSLRFVYLDVCGGDPVAANAHPGGLARQLLGIGLAGVVVMQDVMGQAASGAAAHAFYRAIGQGDGIETAVTAARVAIRLQEDDIIHWSIPALYQPPRPPRQQTLWADWVLDRLIPNNNLPLAFPIMALLLLIAYLSNQLAQINLHQPDDWATLPALLVATTLISLITAIVTTQDQARLGMMYKLQKSLWLPFLIHKYFSAALWPMFIWIAGWGFWLGLYLAGWGNQLPQLARQLVWLFILIGVALASHVGARQAIRQSLLFFKVGFVALPNQIVNYGLLLFILFLTPFLPLLFAWAVWWMGTALGIFFW